VLDAVDDDALRAAHAEGRPVVVARVEPGRGEGRARAPRGWAAALVTDRSLLDLDLTELNVWLSHSSPTYSIAACDLAAGQWGVATTIKVPCSGLGGGRGPEPGAGRGSRPRRNANPALTGPGRPWRSCAPAPPPRRPSRSSQRPTTVATTAKSAIVGLTRWGERELHRLELLRVGRRPDRAGRFAVQGNILVGPGDRPPRWPTRSSRPRVAPLAHRLLDCLAAATGRGRRPARPAIGGALRRRGATAATPGSATCWSTLRCRRPRAADRRARTHLRHATTCSSEKDRRVTSGSTVDASLRAELTERLAQLGYDGAVEGSARGPGQEPENLEEADRRRHSDRSGRAAGSCARGERSWLRDPLDRRPRSIADNCGHADPATAAAPASVFRALRGERLGRCARRRRPRKSRGPIAKSKAPEELYVVLRGTARFTLGEESFDAHPSARSVHALPGIFREAKNRGRARDDCPRHGRRTGKKAFYRRPRGRTSTSPTPTCGPGTPSGGAQRCSRRWKRDPDAWQGPLQRRLLRSTGR